MKETVIFAQYASIGIGFALIALLILMAVYFIGISLGWICASCIRRQRLSVRWFDFVASIVCAFPAFGIWLEILRANRQIFESSYTNSTLLAVGIALGIGLSFGLILFLLYPRQKKPL